MSRKNFIAVSILLLAAVAFADDKPTTRPAEKPATQPAEVDWDKARSLYQRDQRGDKLTAAEQAYLDHAKDVRQKMQRAGGPANVRGNPATGPAMAPRDSTGLVPLTQLTGENKYKGMEGGLYGRGQNSPPEKLLKAALGLAAKIQPLDASGYPAKTGKVVLMSLGMSNTTMEFSRFKQMADRDAAKSPALLIVDGAQGGQDAVKWDTTADKSPWSIADARLTEAGASPHQVQVIWIKQAIAGAGNLGEFPKHSDELKRHLESTIQLAKKRYPNLQLVYLSSRIYAGYASTRLNPEPYAYEGAFSVRGVIDDEQKLKLAAPIALWGPYFWADGIKGRELDSLVWKREDLAADGTHPSDTGRQKVAELLLNFFKTDPTAKGWFSGAP